MNVNELMDNDLFMYGGHLCRFNIRAMDAVIERVEDGKFCYPPCACVEAKPIPLTVELLELNGFKDANANNGLNFRWYVLHVNQEYGDVWGRTDHEIVVAWREYNSDMFVERPYADSTQRKIGVADIRFVHELQHALRLSGLNDLADSFKVKGD